MALKQKTNGRWVCDLTSGRNYRYRETLPSHIKTEEEALNYISTIPLEKYRYYDYNLKARPAKGLFKNAIKYFRDNGDIDFGDQIEYYMKYCLNAKVPTNEIANPSPSIIESYSQSQANLSNPHIHNAKIRAVAKFNSYCVNVGLCKPMNFNIEKFIISSKKVRNSYLSEKFFELLIEAYPKEFLGGQYTNVSDKIDLGDRFPDSILIDNDGKYYVVEIVKGHLDRGHAYKILEYRDRLEKKMVDLKRNTSVGMMVILIGNDCPADREVFLHKYEIKFIKLQTKDVERIILDLLKVRA